MSSSPVQEEPSFLSTDQSDIERDEEFECDAPKFVDFEKLQALNQLPPSSPDKWFEIQQETPYSDRATDVEPLYDPEESSSSSYQSSPVQNNNILDDNTPTPKPKKTLPFDLEESTWAKESIEEEEKLKAKRKLPFSPFKKSELAKSITWADILDEETKPVELQKKQPIVKPQNFVPTRSTKPLTIPVEFKFTQKAQKKAVVIPQVKTETKTPTVKKSHGLTVPKPFRFHETKKHDGPVARSPYVPLAELVKKFDKTPQRFKPLNKQQPAPAPPAQAKKAVGTLTRPKSPKLHTSTRIKKQPVKTSEELEIEEIKKYQFKAKPVDPRILTSVGDLGVPRIKKGQVTIPQSPNIHKPKLHDAPAPSPPRIIKAKPVPEAVIKKPFQPHIKHREIRPADFKLPGDEISQRKKQQFEEELRKKQEEEAKHEFKANPIRIEDVPILPEPHYVPPTEPMSPALVTKSRGKHHQEVLRERIMHEEIETKKMAEFKAHPVPLVEPFIPERSKKPPTENEPFVLNTDLRKDERRQFEDLKKQREVELEQAKLEQEWLKRQKEELEYKKFRKQAEFKAKPVRHLAPFEPKKSEKPLTEPMSPAIGDKRWKKLLQQ